LGCFLQWLEASDILKRVLEASGSFKKFRTLVEAPDNFWDVFCSNYRLLALSREF